jgi:hypothetical protein
MQRHGWLAVLLVLVSAGLCAAQDVRWGRPPVPSSGACFYKETNFRGDYFCVRNGQSYSNLPPGFNDRIYSLRVFGRTPVSVYVDNNFRGAQATTRRNIRDLRNWRTSEGGTWGGRLSSIRVGTGGPGWGGGGQPARACFFSERDFRGQSFCMSAGQSYADLPSGFNDRVQSLQITGDAVVTVYVDNNFRGTQGVARQDYPDLYQWRTDGGTWSRRISSARVASGGSGGAWPGNPGPGPEPGPGDGNWPPPGGGWAANVVPNCQNAIREQLLPQYGGYLTFMGSANTQKAASFVMVSGRANYRDGSGQQGTIDYRCTMHPNGNVAEAKYNVGGNFRPRPQPR